MTYSAEDFRHLADEASRPFTVPLSPKEAICVTALRIAERVMRNEFIGAALRSIHDEEDNDLGLGDRIEIIRTALTKDTTALTKDTYSDEPMTG